MKQFAPISLRAFLRIGLGFVVLLGLCVMMAVQARPAHAAQVFTVTNCSNDAQLQADVYTANGESGDTINFNCSGGSAIIPLNQTLNINVAMTIDGSGQNITLDGQNNVQPIYVGISGNLVGNLTLNALTITHGLSGRGGGLENGGGTVTITNSTFVNNDSSAFAGAIDNGGTMTITNSTITNNSASTYGGGISNENTMTITNSTISGNSAVSGGGGILLTSSTSLSISGSIVAENTSTNPNNDCANYGTITDNGYNMDSDSSCFTASTSKHGNPQLSTLASNGGPTQTMALQQGSPAIDQVPLASCPPTDQRGNARPDDASETACDIGAYESSYAASTLTLTGTSINATEGSAFTGVIATGTANGTTNPLSASIAWGDGGTSTASITPTNGSYSVSGTHTYAEEGLYTISITVKDGGGLQASTTSSATVNDANLTLTHFVAGSIGHLKAGLAATFTDADPAGQVSDYQATINWGDGTTATVTVGKNPLGKGFALAGTHNYARKGTYTITLTISDTGGSKVTKTVKATVK